MKEEFKEHLESMRILGDTKTFPSYATVVRTVLGDGGFGTLTTTALDGRPYGNIAAYSTLADGSPMVCISELATHTRYANAHPAGGMFVMGDTPEGADPLDSPRASLVGDLVRHKPSEEEIEAFLKVHPSVAYYYKWDDFDWWRLQITSCRFVGGFGIMGWVDLDDLAKAECDVVAKGSMDAINHMNAGHTDASLEICQKLGGLPTAVSAKVRDMDSVGVTFSARSSQGGWHFVRVKFDSPVSSPDELRTAMIEMAKKASAAAAPEA